MKTAEWHRGCRSGDYIVQFKKDSPFIILH